MTQRWFCLLAVVLAGSLNRPRIAATQQPARRDSLFVFDLRAQPMARAFAAYTALTGWRLNTDSATIEATLYSLPVTGSLTAQEGLRRMLAGTGLGFRVGVPGEATVISAPITLSAVTVTGERVSPYQGKETRSLTKTETPLRDIPQSVTVLTRAAIADQAMLSLADATRYVPGVTMGQGEGNRDQPYFRGNNGNGDLYVDGVRDDVEYLRDLYNVERVEIPKGSNALIFGRGAGGGLINRVSKQATWIQGRELTLQYGANNNRRAVLDLNRGLSGRFAARVSGMYENSDSYREYFNLERYAIAPTMTLVAGPSTQVRFGYEFFNDYRTADRGVPSFSGLPLETEPQTFFGDPSLSWSDATVNSGTVTLDHETASGLKVHNTTRYSAYRKMYQNVYPGPVDSTATNVSMLAYNNRMWRNNFFNQTDLNITRRTGRVKHVLLVGGEFGRQSTDAFRNTGYFNNTALSVSVPVASPITTGTPITFRQSATDADAHTTALSASGYVQDQIELAPQLTILAGARLDNFDLSYHNNRTDADLSRTDLKVSPRFGLVVKPAQPFSLYASYGTSFLPASGALFTALTVTTQTLEPEEFRNYEIGAKWDVRGVLSLTAGAYRLDRTNTSAPDPLDPTHTVQTGSQRSKGIELSGAGNVTRAWEVLAGYSYLDAEITSQTLQAAPGAVVPAAPKHTFSLWNRYNVTRGVGLAAGIVRQSSMYAAIDNAVTLPGFTRVDGAAYLSLGRGVRAQLNVENVFGVRYWAQSNGNNNITPGSPRVARMVWTVQP